MTQAVALAQQASTGVSQGFKNRIINGAMVIDQRNAGASVTPANGQYSLDRWKCWQAAASKYTIGQYSTSPTGFTKSIGVSSNSSYSVGADEYFAVAQLIEGFNVADLGWGTANAKTVTLSFQVRSSLTGTFGGAINNANLTRSYPFSYTIASADTWTTVSVTIPGDTTGTWNTDNSGGIYVWFSLGSGANNVGPANTWAGAWYTAPTGSVSVVGTNGANWYITGVQLEVGSTATSFDYRPYGTELQLCQRYFQVIGGGPPDSTAARNEVIASGMQFTSTEIYYPLRFIQEMRTAPTLTLAGNLRYYRVGTSATVTTALFEGTTIRTTRIYIASSSGTAGDASWLQMGGFENDRLSASAEL